MLTRDAFYYPKFTVRKTLTLVRTSEISQTPRLSRELWQKNEQTEAGHWQGNTTIIIGVCQNIQQILSFWDT